MIPPKPYIEHYWLTSGISAVAFNAGKPALWAVTLLMHCA